MIVNLAFFLIMGKSLYLFQKESISVCFVCLYILKNILLEIILFLYIYIYIYILDLTQCFLNSLLSSVVWK